MTTVRRRDVRVPNESNAFVLTSGAMRGAGISPGDPGWKQALLAGDALALSVESEGPANVRVAVGGELDVAERAEWVGRVRGGLRLRDGRLALCGGVAYLLERAGWAEEHARVVDVPAGDYRATLYCYASAPNGRACVERSGSDEPLGAWFRRTRAGQEMPAWLHNLCVSDPTTDPGQAKKWKRAKERSGGDVVDFLLHLEATDGPLTPADVAGDGCSEAGECRKPEPFPMGVPAVDLERLDEGEDEDNDAAAAVDVVDVQARLTGDTLQPIDGGAVAVPVVKLTRVARIGWMCHPYTQPAVRISFPGRVLRLEEVENAVFEVEGRTLHVGFEDTGQPSGATEAVLALARQLAALPDGTVIELDMARRSSPGREGRHRYRGAVSGGSWQIADAFPTVKAAVIAEALALIEALENGRRFLARDEDEAARIEVRAAKHLADYFGGNTLQRTGTELALRRRDPALFAHVVARAFWMRYAGTWPLPDEDAAG